MTVALTLVQWTEIAQDGFRAFKNGQDSFSCPYPATVDSVAEQETAWLYGWLLAKRRDSLPEGSEG